MDYSGKIIWITGATSGIGKSMAIELARAGRKLILSGRNEKALQDTAENCTKLGAEVTCIPFDLGDMSSIEQAAKTVLQEFKTVDCLYHVGGFSQRAFVLDTPLDIDRKIMEVNFFGTVALTKAILPVMIKNGGGHICVTSSIVGKFGFPYRSAYSASKQALHGFFESLRAENVINNVRVSIIIPGRINTNISLNAINEKGEKHGIMDDGQANGTPADKAARKIVRKLEREKKEILVGGKELMMVHIRRFLPSLYYRLSAKVKPL
jgi:dehydrogenase/reductase SDR family member 7B